MSRGPTTVRDAHRSRRWARTRPGSPTRSHGSGIANGDRVGTFCWNTQEHLEAYLAVPSMGAVLHTLNIRLFPEQLAFVINHAQDKLIIVDDSLIPVLAKVAAELATVERYVVVGGGDTSALSAAVPAADILRYTDIISGEPASYDWPEIDERQAAAFCYTSGTTGNPKGVAYSHRSAYLHSLAATTPAALDLSERERILTIVPMFHANAWGIPYAAFMCGASVVMPGRFLQAEPLTRMIKEERVTFSGAVPTIWADILRYGEEHEIDLSTVRMVVCGGSAVPRSLMEKFQERYGVRIVQGWGMTETSPLAAVGHAPASVELGTVEEMDWRARTGRIVSGVELRIVDDLGNPLPWDDEAVGEIEIRGPWITGSYYRDPSAREVRQRLVAHRRRRLDQLVGLRADHRPRQGRDQVGWGMDQLGRAREPLDGASRRDRGERDRGARPALVGTPVGVRRAQAGFGRGRRGAGRLSR